MNDNYQIVLNKIKKNYKNTEFLLDVYLENYRNTYLYIRIDYYKKQKVYRLSWLDLAFYNDNFDEIVSYEYLPIEAVNYLKEIISKIKVDNTNTYNGEYTVTINSDILTSDNTKFNYSFNRYIDRKNKYLFDAMATIFNNLPRKLGVFMDEMGASIIGTNHIYKNTFVFDLFKDEITDIANDEIITRGKKYVSDGKVFFLEKIANKYYAIVGGTNLYATVIEYDEEKKETTVSCTCPCDSCCKHIIATILAIREGKFHSFYKISNKMDDMPLLDRVMNFNYLLTIGIDDNNENYIVIEDDQIKILPVIVNGKSNWFILEDDKKETLTKRLNDIEKNL